MVLTEALSEMLFLVAWKSAYGQNVQQVLTMSFIHLFETLSAISLNLGQFFNKIKTEI